MNEETEKLRAIYQLLFDIVTGRPTVDLDKAAGDSNAYDDLYNNLYALGEQLRSLVLASGVVPPIAVFEHEFTCVFVLDTSYRLKDFNAKVIERLGYIPKTIRYQKFDILLTDSAAMEWYKQMELQKDDARFFVVMELEFVASNGAQLPLYCTITNTFFEDWVFVVCVEVFLEAFHSRVHHTHTPSDLVHIEQLHTYILAHLDEGLPPIKALALRFGIHQYALRQGFKAHYGTSIYQFYHDARLKKGYQLILQTRLQLKDIAYQCGFSSYINFYKAFKKKFGMAPSVLLRPE